MTKQDDAGRWRNRIVGHGEEAPDQLLANPGNWRIHPQAQQDALAGAIRDVGYIRSVTVNRTTGHVVDGHLRVALALRNGEPSLPVEYVELSEAEEAEALATLDPLAAMAATDKAKLDALLREVQTGEAGVQQMLADLAAQSGLDYGASGAGVEDAGAQVDKAEELRVKWGVEAGQLWQLGEHRLICGDCTDKATVDAVAFGNHVDLWVSDPPYGVSYADKNAYLNAVAKGNSIQTPIINDHLTVEEASELWRKAFGIVHQIAKPGCVYYVNAPQGGDLMMMMMILREVGWLLKPQIIWVKNNHVLGRSDYQLKHEPILYGWKDGGSHYWCGSRSEISVWNVDKPTNSNYHPTTKPIELMEKAITNSSHAGEIVFDGFLGSGTTLIACEKLGRKCRAVEISPAYVAVALERWAQSTGQTPVLLTD